MKKRKITYSLTAQQKKKLKQQNESGELTEEQKQERAEKAQRRKTTIKTAIISGTALLLAAVAIVLAVVLLPLAEIVNSDTFLHWSTFNPDDPENLYTDDNPNPNPPDNPIVTITIKGDDESSFKQIFGSKEVKLYVEIFMDDAKYAGMNFMYLAESGFYDGTIINDIHNDHAMFSGFTDSKNSSHKSKQTNIIHNLKGFIEHNIDTFGYENFKLGYRLYTEGSQPSNSSLGYLTMLAGSSSYYPAATAFMLMTGDNPKLYYGDVGNEQGYNISSYLSWLGRVTDDDSMGVLKKFNSVQTSVSGKYYCPDSAIRITSVTTNLSDAKRNYLLNNFEELIEGGVYKWYDKTHNETYHKFAE